MRRALALAGFGVLLAALTAAPPATAALPVEFHDCGDTITASFRLGNDIACVTGQALKIDASDVTVDLGGHRIHAAGGVSIAGINVSTAAEDVRVRNGVVSGFTWGVYVNGPHASLEGLTLLDNDNGVAVLGADDVRVSDNTIVGSGSKGVYMQSDALRTTVTGNTIVGGDFGVSVSSTGPESDHVITRNEIIGPLGGISVISSDGNTVARNRVYAPGTDGIDLSDSDGNTVSRNIVRGGANGIDADGAANRFLSNETTGNRFSGIRVAGGSGIEVRKNRASANVGKGIEVLATAAGPIIARNKAHENGDTGIFVGGSDPILNKNATNYNGYNLGISDPLGWGIDAGMDADGTRNTAKGNDQDTGQCDPLDLCTVKGLAPPPLKTCTTPATAASFKLHNPLDCGGDAVVVSGDGITIDLGKHYVSGGSGAGESAVEVPADLKRVTVKGGVVADSTNGVAFGKGFGHRVVDSLVARNDLGVVMTQLGRMPGDPSGRPRNAIKRVRIVGNSAIGAALTDTSTTDLTSNTVAMNQTGIALLVRAVRNTVAGNRIIGNIGDGVLTDNVGDPVESTISSSFARNRIVGNQGDGLALFNASGNRIERNTVIANGSDPGDAGIALRGDADVGGEPGGSSINSLSRNVSTANLGDGIAVVAKSTGNRLASNRLTRNIGVGLSFLATVYGAPDDNIVRKNKVLRNTVAGMVIEAATNVSSLRDNTANANGYVGDDDGDPPDEEDVADGIGLGIDAVPSTPGNHNTAKDNDDTDQCDPAPPLPPCG